MLICCDHPIKAKEVYCLVGFSQQEKDILNLFLLMSLNSLEAQNFGNFNFKVETLLWQQLDLFNRRGLEWSFKTYEYC